jgi:hypothetical protein
MPVILASQEAKAGEPEVPVQPGLYIRTLSPKEKRKKRKERKIKKENQIFLVVHLNSGIHARDSSA